MNQSLLSLTGPRGIHEIGFLDTDNDRMKLHRNSAVPCQLVVPFFIFDRFICCELCDVALGAKNLVGKLLYELFRSVDHGVFGFIEDPDAQVAKPPIVIDGMNYGWPDAVCDSEEVHLWNALTKTKESQARQ